MLFAIALSHRLCYSAAMRHLLVISALSREISHLLKRFKTARDSSLGGFQCRSFTAYGKKISVIISGMGQIKAAAAARQGAHFHPDILISTGFCGALSPDTVIGEVFTAAEICSLQPQIDSPATIVPDVVSRLSRHGRFISTESIVAKTDALATLPASLLPSLLEMESFAIASVCRELQIPFSALRSVSDRLDQDPADIFRRICTADLGINPAKIAAAIFQTPSVVTELCTLQRQTCHAARSLADALEQTLEQL